MTAIAVSIAAYPLMANPIHPFDAVLTICHSTDMTGEMMHESLVDADWFPIAPADLPDEVLQAFVARSALAFVESDDGEAFLSHWEKQSSAAWMNRLLPDAMPTDHLRRFYLHSASFSLLQVSSASNKDGSTAGVGCSVTFTSEVVPDWFRAIAEEAISGSADVFLQGLSGYERSSEWMAEAEVFFINQDAISRVTQENVRFEVIWNTQILSLEHRRN
ncbi:hypothetical protein [Yoonia vestfoldensis]|uniref:hypothetical protein n=1 Tax=Yoonia vestfoldensis TaxID=245188 RepID=UPI00037AA0BC|nr:hypothetical protein [Yoonia vestfoldensis]